eukprot:jgi/Mesvir1/13013/Mv06014-RA.1
MSRMDHPRFQWNRSKSQIVYGTGDDAADRKDTQYRSTIGRASGREPVTSPSRVRHEPTTSNVELSWGQDDKHKWETGRWVEPVGTVERPHVTAHPSDSRVQIGDGSGFSTSRGTTKDTHKGLPISGERAHNFKDKYANRERPYDNGSPDDSGGGAWVSSTRQSYPQYGAVYKARQPVYKTGHLSQVVLGEETSAQKAEHMRRAATAMDAKKEMARRERQERRKLLTPPTHTEGFSMVGLNYEHDAPPEFYRTHAMAAYPPRKTDPPKPLPHSRTKSQFKLGGTAAAKVDPKEMYETTYVRSHSPVKGRRGEEDSDGEQHSPPAQRYTFTTLRYASQRIGEGMMIGDDSPANTNRFMTRHREAFAPPNEREQAISPRGAAGGNPPPYAVRVAADKTRSSFSLKMSDDAAAAHEKPTSSYANNFVQHKVPDKVALPCRYSSAQVASLNKRHSGAGEGLGTTVYTDMYTNPRKNDYAKRAPVHKTFSNFQLL